MLGFLVLVSSGVVLLVFGVEWVVFWEDIIRLGSIDGFILVEIMELMKVLFFCWMIEIMVMFWLWEMLLVVIELFV